LHGDHFFVGSSFGDAIYGMAGNDTIIENGAASFLYGGDGDDTILGGSYDDMLYGGSGNDVMNGGAGFDWVDYQDANGGVKVDLFLTTAQNTRSAGIDTLTNFEAVAGSAYADILSAASTGSSLYGFLGDDLITGRAGNDLLNGGGGNDTIIGGGGNDTIIAEDWSSFGNDMVDGGAGRDTADYFAVTGSLTIDLRVTSAQNTGSAGVDTIVNVENVRGSLYDDLLTGNAVANHLFGWTGNDTLSGMAGNDTLDGFAGADQLYGGSGNDVLYGGVTSLAAESDALTGGAGADTFVFLDATWSTATGTDHILDFDASEGDRIDLHALALVGAHFIGEGAFTGVAGEIHVVNVNGVSRVEMDTNGDSIADGLLIDVSSASVLIAGDFLF
jgi:Ca2+-binding RTX toxin-like protein